MPSNLEQPPYKRYRSGPRGLKERLRGEDEPLVPPRGGDGNYNRYGGGRRGLRNPFRRTREGEPKKKLTPGRVIKWIVIAIFAWLLLSFVLFMISAQTRSGNLPSGASSQLSSGGPMLTSANTILILGLDNRPTSGPGSKEGGLQASNFSEADANTDSMMLWRLGGGTSRRLSIPRDTLVNIPGHGLEKINAAWSIGGPALTLKVVKQLTGLQINHLLVIDLGNFPKFIDDVGGVTVNTPRICSNISGGVKNGGFTLDLSPGAHHLDGEQALVLARTRDNSCNPAYNDLSREAMQQQILNSVKSQLLTFHTFFHLPWAAWDAPGVIQTDMGGLSLMQMFIASEIGGSAPVSLLSESGQSFNGEDVLVPNQANVHAQVQKLLTGK
ncbi:MAG TPA: LCP family protein [Solirubrobacteraceae bacterium]|nr:LCP family protein [Solirubrobacteraceae bacterium]